MGLVGPFICSNDDAHGEEEKKKEGGGVVGIRETVRHFREFIRGSFLYVKER